ncbi:hypothetical protein LTR10_013033 [Elasticomyces elasticus]|uniref:Hydantoinase B/oxoprolinase domain-containing protein n=1 Tax=Exophiala sideris TaxID=1016849 RepID=A0ABR0JAX1_9EURO|nr:hypothetical protein LTR10_013033 [Elasticomyces elasticus]KAK5030409.1 hypothetical protein LTS07_005193 [Exophiala sideris]KAK5038462.1 hypothetical protein LTR13_004209 [Exophiala sideris]KAK5060345.1 hypothetical protein LTR69_005662 [Exophiala sideris]KAK5183255.1 hypothetical protein LTR44_004256 [Eurotiomycetes sp. CCFEE 6388]
MPTKHGIRFAIDRGGTFTDLLATGVPGHGDVVLKLLSVDPANYQDAPIEGIRRVLSMVEGRDIPRGELLSTEQIESIRMGTTVATNALLERKGDKCVLVTTAGFGDVLEIGTQSRPNLFDLAVRKPDMLYSEVLEVEERVTMEGATDDPDCDFGALAALAESDPDLVRCTSGDIVRIMKRPDPQLVTKSLQQLFDKGYRSLTVAFAHSYAFPDHEKLVAQIASSIGFECCSLSSEISPTIKLVTRGLNATADAYLTPVTARYIEGFRHGFKGALEGENAVRCDFMTSDGGLASWQKFSGAKAILSGPAGGYVGFARTSYDDSDGCPVIGFDMGGTSTDVSRYAGQFEHIFESTTAGITLKTPQLDISTVAAGGGSILFWENGLFRVGPESASAHPGPACYRKDGPLTVTDANLLLGRLLPEYFPAIFGPNEDLPLDKEVTRKLFNELAAVIKEDIGRSMTPEEIALGFIEVANETMARPVRALTESRGHETSKHRLASFGGAGGQHACDMAAALGINSVVIHKYSSILSAHGMDLADITHETQAPCSEVYSEKTLNTFAQRVQELKSQAIKALEVQGIPRQLIHTEYFYNMRFQGTESQIMISPPPDGDFIGAFKKQYKREFSFMPQNRDVYVDNVRVRSFTKTQIGADQTPYEQLKDLQGGRASKRDAVPEKSVSVYFRTGGWTETPVYILQHVHPNTEIPGPAMILDKTQTIVVQPNCKAIVLQSHVFIEIGTGERPARDNDHIDPVLLSVFAHRFMSIAEQMGHTLQKTSVSVAIKERLDFSCAIFGPDGGLCANAPHVPVHLGSMQSSVQYQHKRFSNDLKPGDIIMTNHPRAGGTHLPDITIISPTFDQEGKNILFYVASRGHHLDIGGLRGVSMHPDATELWHEGAAVEHFKIVSQGKFDEEGVHKILVDEPGQYPDCVGSTHYEDNLSDLRAQIAANTRGIELIQKLIAEYGSEMVLRYMHAIQATSEAAVRSYLKSVAATKDTVLQATDFFDDGSQLCLKVTIDPKTGGAEFDFRGSSPEINGTSNAPASITMSAVIYTVRCLVASDISMNQGVLAPIRTILPEDSIINPSEEAAVSTGNGLTSQRLVDVILKTFQAVAGSQGCMNCLSMFGRPLATGGYAFNYGETICGGNGAGPTWNGSRVPTQSHMTNTRATDVEVLEKRYPMIVREFSIRKDSGGDGLYKGGNGARRVFEARKPLTWSFMSERRVQEPFGLAGGKGGSRGLNLWMKKGLSGKMRTVNLGPKTFFTLRPGESFVIHTPGGGGWGDPNQVQEEASPERSEHKPVVQYQKAAGSIAARQEAHLQSV